MIHKNVLISIELITGMVALLVYFIVGHDNTLQTANIVLVLLTHFLHFIIIPSAYNLNTGVVKKCILKNGWLRSFRAIAPDNCEHDEQDVANFHQNDHRARNIPPLPNRATSAEPRAISVSKEFDLEVVSVE